MERLVSALSALSHAQCFFTRHGVGSSRQPPTCIQQREHRMRCASSLSLLVSYYQAGLGRQGAQLPEKHRRIRMIRPLQAGAPRWNPQNTDQPLFLPSPEYSPAETVAIQLDALAKCDDPWPNHGLQLAYEFGYDIGGLDPSMYFGVRNDLYHQDHFMGKFQTKLPELVNLREYTIEGACRRDIDQDDTDEEWIVRVAVMPATGETITAFAFHLRRKTVGSRKGSLMTAMIVRSTD